MRDTAAIESFINSLVYLFRGDDPHEGTILQILFHCQVHLQRWLLWQKADMAFGCYWVLPHIDPFDMDASFCLLENTADDIHHR